MRRSKEDEVSRHILDCGCVLTDEGRHWCPTCVAGGQSKRIMRVEEARAILRAHAQQLRKAGNYRPGEIVCVNPDCDRLMGSAKARYCDCCGLPLDAEETK